ncbi:hypothetical protein GGR53DRAFT_393706 [Hypoxylon sp. FL1150]|nr:hypothetical protein GGR53DRAFT_393706 [Hypoxylon sp. FL1150]
MMDSSPHQAPLVEAPNDAADDTAAPAPQILDTRHGSDPTPALTSGPPPGTRRCFICLVDEPETPLPSDWRMPCTCTLEGHQDCLLDWVADLEAQGREIRCTICKSPITVTERLDFAVQLSNYLSDRFSEWSPKILLGFLASSALVSSSIYGAKAIDWFAGPDALTDFLLNSDDVTAFVAMRQDGRIQDRTRDLPVNMSHFAVLPFIAPALILGRIRQSEVILIPASILYTTLIDQSDEDFNWPPSIQRALSLYPVIQATYCHLHRTLSRNLEKRWKVRARKQLSQEATEQQPAEQPAPQPPPPAQGHPEPAAREVGFVFAFDLQIGGGQEEVNDNNNIDVVNPRNRDPESPLFNFLAGTLLWPGVCYGAGELLRLALPARFVTRPAAGPATGILQQRWGRSLVGGCLFVVLKDAFFLWVKYRKTMNRASRHIKNARGTRR